MNIRIVKRDERERRIERGGTDEPKTAEQIEREVARQTITKIEAWVDEFRQKRQAESVRARRLLLDAA